MVQTTRLDQRQLKGVAEKLRLLYLEESAPEQVVTHTKAMVNINEKIQRF